MKLKVCGLNDRENILELVKYKPDYIGFIFYPRSPRFIGCLSPDFVAGLSDVKKVGVFVNEPGQSILDAVRAYGLDLVQLHGDESPEACAEVRRSVPVIKAFHVDDAFDFQVTRAYGKSCDFFLFDSKSKSYGGSGRSFDHGKLEGYKFDTPAFLSGGLNLNITEDLLYLESVHPNIVGIDVNSRFEVSPGLKDAKKVEMLTEKMRKNELHS